MSTSSGEDLSPIWKSKFDLAKQYLIQCKGNVSAAAKMMGISRSTLHRWMRTREWKRNSNITFGDDAQAPPDPVANGNHSVPAPAAAPPKPKPKIAPPPSPAPPAPPVDASKSPTEQASLLLRPELYDDEIRAKAEEIMRRRKANEQAGRN